MVYNYFVVNENAIVCNIINYTLHRHVVVVTDVRRKI